MTQFFVDEPDAPVLETKEVAECMGRIVSESRYPGGSVVSIIKGVGETVVFEGQVVRDGKGRVYGGTERVAEVLGRERGKGEWALEGR